MEFLLSSLLISSAPKKQIADFYSNQNLIQFDNVQFLVDEDFRISNHFGVHTIPTIFLYNADKKLIFKHNGEIKIQTLINRISNNVN
ncbi:hypothetical protein FACS1894177_02180 [Bacteroidia bacterium]|nr:hypothetical protein FACS1894177_02180 [Bacteroidia bacterium]